MKISLFVLPIVAVLANNRFGLPAINLNLLDANDTYSIQLQMFDQTLRQYAISEKKEPTEVDWVQAYDWGEIGKFEIDKCLKFYENSKYMKFIVRHLPKSVVLCKDTGTVLVPSQNILNFPNDHLDQFSVLSYQEIEVDVVESIHSGKMYPASSCLNFVDGKGSGTVEIEYCTSWDIKREFDPIFQVPYNPFVNSSFAISLSFTMNRNFGSKVRFTGSHKCTASNGTGVRLFFEPNTVKVNGNYREATWWGNKNRWVKQRWIRANDLYYVDADYLPKFYCLTSDRTDLKCDEPVLGVEREPIPGEEEMNKQDDDE